MRAGRVRRLMHLVPIRTKGCRPRPQNRSRRVRPRRALHDAPQDVRDAAVMDRAARLN